ncbi:unnamed protein product [Closterium sp. NIES-53]
MASPPVLASDAEGRPVKFETWLDDLHLFLQLTAKEDISLYDHALGHATAPAASAYSTARSQWQTRDAHARFAIRNSLPIDEREHFGQHKTAQALYTAVVARYSSPASAALGRLSLPYLFPDLASFQTVADLITHLRTSEARFRAAMPDEFLAKNPPPLWLTLYHLVTRLPDTLRSVRDHFLARCPTELTIALLEKELLAAEASIVAVGASRGDPRTPFFEGCSPSPLLPSVASAAAVDLLCAEKVGTASASSGRRSGKGKGGKGGGPLIHHLSLGTRVSATPGAGEAAALGACASAPPGTESTAALHTFTLDSGASRCFFRDRTALEPLARPVAVSLADPSGGPVIATSSTVLPCPAVPSGTLSDLHLPSFSTNLVAGCALQDGGRSSSVLGSSCEAEIYAGAMAAQELRWLTYLLTDLGELPLSPPVLYVDNKAMLALCREQRLEHRTKHIALRYFLARELQQRGQLRLAYVASEANTADVFTKALAPCDH